MGSPLLSAVHDEAKKCWRLPPLPLHLPSLFAAPGKIKWVTDSSESSSGARHGNSTILPGSFLFALFVAVCCSVLQCVAVCCSVLQCAAVCCSVLQCAAVCCSVLQCVAVCCSVLQCVAVCCSRLQYVAMCWRQLYPFWGVSTPLRTGS